MKQNSVTMVSLTENMLSLEEPDFDGGKENKIDQNLQEKE